MVNRFPNNFLTGLRMTKPIIQAPMTGYVTEQMVIAVSNAGGLGSLPATFGIRRRQFSETGDRRWFYVLDGDHLRGPSVRYGSGWPHPD